VSGEHFELDQGQGPQLATSAEIEGVRVTGLETRADERGSFTEVYRKAWFSGGPVFVQGNLSRSHMGVVRGMHYHVRQADLWVPIDGTITIGLHDVRSSSPTGGASMTLDLGQSPDTRAAVFIPPGVAHGFCATSELLLLYLVDREYDGTDEHGFSPTDPALGFTWPVASPILSDRDREAPGLNEALAAHPIIGTE
jgi:dTDP-4-dehydrorhamnose 3,5-epimerase